MKPIDSWPRPAAGALAVEKAPSPNDEAMLRSYGLDRSFDYGMSLEDLLLLDKRVRSGADWVQVLTHLGEDQLQRAAQQVDRRHSGSASTFYLHGAACFRLAQAGMEEEPLQRLAMYQRQVSAFRQGAELSGRDVRSRQITYAGVHHQAWLVRPESRPQLARGVLVWGGADGWCEAFWRSVPSFLERGLAVCLIELPGQGLARLQHGSFLSSTFTQMVSQVIDQFGSWGLDPQSAGVVGHSMGGTLAMAAAAADPRIRACVSNGGLMEKRGEDKFPRATRRVERLLGPGGDAQAFYRSLDLRARLPAMRGKLLCVQGGCDPLVADEQAHQIVALRGPADATLAYWPDGVHCVYNHATERNSLVADWLAHALGTDPPG